LSRLAALAALLALLFAGPAASAAAPVAHARASRPAPPGIGATIPAPVTDAKLQAALARIAANAPGRCGIVAIDLRTGRTARVHGIDRIPMASLSKLPVALAVLDAVDRQRFSLSLPVALRTAAHGEQLRTVHDLLEAMMVQSDDTACDALLGRVGGPRAVSVWLRRHRLPGIRIERTELERGNDWYGLTQGPLGGGAPAEVVQKLRDAVAPTERTTAAEAFLHDPRDTGSPAAFAELLRHPAVAGVPVVVETPSEGFAGHQADIATLNRLAKTRRTARPRAKSVNKPA